MPRYYFNITYGDDCQPDLDGTEFNDLRQAQSEVVRTLAELARDEFPRDGDHQNIAIDLLDADRRPLLRAAISFDLERLVRTDQTAADGVGEDRLDRTARDDAGPPSRE